MSRSPDLERKLDVLMSLAADDREGLPPRLRHARSTGALNPINIRYLRPLPGMRMSLLRILMTNACSYNCHYCPMRRDREMPRTLLKPEELVRIFLGARARGWCEGLFVTTGIPGRPVKVMDDLITALELLRERHRFGGYIHVKLVPGGQAAQIERLAQLASRVSVNLEAPCGASLTSIAPEKSFGTAVADLERVRGHLLLERAERAHGKPADTLHPGAVAGMTMQFVVGATPDTDRTILGTVGTAERGRRHPPRALQRLPSHREHPAGGRARSTGPARAPALPGRSSHAELRLRGGRGGLRTDGQSSARGGPQGRLGNRSPRAVPGRGSHRLTGGAAPRPRHRPDFGTPDRGRASRNDHSQPGGSPESSAS